MIYVGLDLHKRYITACAIDVAGQLIAEQRRLLTDLTVVSAWLGRLTGPVTVVLEATFGPKYAKDRISDLAQRELLFYVLRDREVFPNRTGKKFCCCPKCTSKLYECVSAKVFRYIDNAKWKTDIETGQRGVR